MTLKEATKAAFTILKQVLFNFLQRRRICYWYISSPVVWKNYFKIYLLGIREILVRIRTHHGSYL
jgi:hypothetical protein